jgi:hypothetical protein
MPNPCPHCHVTPSSTVRACPACGARLGWVRSDRDEALSDLRIANLVGAVKYGLVKRKERVNAR